MDLGRTESIAPPKLLMRRAGAILRRVGNSPILISQVLASATGAITMFFAVSWMSHTEYLLFALVNLASATLLAFARVAVFQPALIQHRTDKRAVTPFQYALLTSLGAGVLLMGVSFLFGIRSPLELSVVGASLLFPVWQDWARHRCLVIGLRWRTAAGEAARLIVTVALLAAFRGVEAGYYQALANAAGVVALVLQLGRHSRTREWTPFRQYLRPASLQAVDYIVATLNSIIPLMILGSIPGGIVIGGFRIAQTLLGPLNLVFAASRTTLLADGATKDSHSKDSSLISAGSQLSIRLCALGALVVGAAVVVVWAFDIEFSGVSHDALILGIVAVGLVAVTSGWSGIHTILLRMLGANTVVTIGRSVLVVVTWAGFAVGYALGGVDGSVVTGFAVSAVLYPLVFVLPARFVYRRVRSAPAASDSAAVAGTPLRLVLIADGDPRNRRTNSGVASGLLTALERRSDVDVVALADSTPSRMSKYAWLLLSFRFDRTTWVNEYRKGFGMRLLRSRRRDIAADKAPAHDLVLHVRNTYKPSKGPYAVFIDGTASLSQGWKPWALTPRSYRSRLKAERDQFDSASFIFTAGQHVRDEVIRAYDQPSGKVTAVGGGINTATGQVAAERSERPGRRILFVGIDFERKGGEVLLDAFAVVRERIPGVRLDIVGPAKRAEIPGVVQHGFVRDRQQLDQLYSDADVFCLPSLYEPYGLVLNEALANGLPCVVSDRGALPELIGHGRAGIITPVGQARALASALIRLLEDNAERVRLGAGGQQLAREATWDRVVERMVAELIDIHEPIRQGRP